MENLIQVALTPTSTSIHGFEALSLGDKFSLFYKEMTLTTDKRLALLNKSVHKVDITAAQKNIKAKNILYVKKTTTQLLVPEGYRPGLGSMAAHTKAVREGVYIITSLKTEAGRLYDWLKQIIKTGRMDKSYQWNVTDFDKALESSVNFLKTLPPRDRQVTYPLGQVYISFEEFYEIVSGFNHSVEMIGSRDAEIIAKELTAVYDLGSLLTTKIKANDLVLSPEAILDIETSCNRFVDLCNLAGANMVLLNELTAVFKAQADTFAKF